MAVEREEAAVGLLFQLPSADASAGPHTKANGMSHQHVSQLTGGDQPLEFAEMGLIATHVTDHQHDTGTVRGFDHGIALFQVQGHRLLTKDVQTCFCRVYCESSVGVIRCHDGHRVEFLFLKHGLVA